MEEGVEDKEDGIVGTCGLGDGGCCSYALQKNQAPKFDPTKQKILHGHTLLFLLY